MLPPGFISVNSCLRVTTKKSKSTQVSTDRWSTRRLLLPLRRAELRLREDLTLVLSVPCELCGDNGHDYGEPAPAGSSLNQISAASGLSCRGISVIAPVGHAALHTPQPKHLAGSMYTLESADE